MFQNKLHPHLNLKYAQELSNALLHMLGSSKVLFDIVGSFAPQKRYRFTVVVLGVSRELSMDPYHVIPHFEGLKKTKIVR